MRFSDLTGWNNIGRWRYACVILDTLLRTRASVRIGVPSSNVRIADSSIQPVREVDIISLLNSSVVMGSDVECVIEP